jgi:hypothetical protein
MCILRSLHARRLFLCLGLLGALILSGGCSESNPVSESPSSAPPPGAMTGDKMKEARLKGLGTTGIPSSKKETPKK